MRDGGRLAAAINVLEEIETRRRPAADVLKDWGLNHRFAGSKDRAAIGNLVYDALRQRLSASHVLQSDSPRAAILAVYSVGWRMGLDRLDAVLKQPHAPEELSERERSHLVEAEKKTEDREGEIQNTVLDIPPWITQSFSRVFGDDLEIASHSLSLRAPVDLRVNTLKADRSQLLTDLSPLQARSTVYAPHGIRLTADTHDKRIPCIKSEPEFLQGLLEVQDEGSQLSALVAGAEPKARVLDLCCGAGGKTLALACHMHNRGRVFAFDRDKHRMRNLYTRSSRAGVRNLTIIPPARLTNKQKDSLDSNLQQLEGSIDIVVVDAPCTGTGTWRRRPDSKWRLSPKSLATRLQEQDEVLKTALRMLAPGGHLVYITCSVLAEENEDRIAAFLQQNRELEVIDPVTRVSDYHIRSLLQPFVRSDLCHFPVLRLTPHATGTDGFCVTTLCRRS